MRERERVEGRHTLANSRRGSERHTPIVQVHRACTVQSRCACREESILSHCRHASYDDEAPSTRSTLPSSPPLSLHACLQSTQTPGSRCGGGCSFLCAPHGTRTAHTSRHAATALTERHARPRRAARRPSAAPLRVVAIMDGVS